MDLSQLKNIQPKLEAGKFLWISENWNTDSFKDFIQDIDSRFKNGDIIYADRNTLAIFQPHVHNGLEKDIIVKKFNLTKKYDQLRFRFLSSKAVRSLIIACAFKEIGLKTPLPVAVVEAREKNKRIHYSYYVTEYIPYDYSLLDITKQENHPYRDKIPCFLPQIARDIRKMHDAGIIHNDLHAGNILIRRIDSEPEFYYIDLNRARLKNKLDETKRLKDLARFNFSRKEQEVFLQHYAPENHQELLDTMLNMRSRRERTIKYKRTLKRLVKR